MWVRRAFLGAVSGPFLLLALGLGDVLAATINFDTDPAGNPLFAPTLFSQTTHLSEVYAPWGVHFSGPALLDGGGILDQNSNFGVLAHSGRNFLAFNPTARFSDTGIPRNPETITFDLPIHYASIYVSGGRFVRTISLKAYDINNLLLASAAVNTVRGQWSTLSVISPHDIAQLQLLDTTSFVADDLVFTSVLVPLPPALWGGLALLGALGIRRIRRRAA
jgi:hypothetical protein